MAYHQSNYESFEVNEEQPDFFSFQQYLGGDSPTYNMEPFHPVLSLSPPNSCPVTPTIGNHYFNENEDTPKEFYTNAPELEHYLRQINPLQETNPKRKCDFPIGRHENMKRTRCEDTNNDSQYQSLQSKTESEVNLSCCQKTVKWSKYKTEDIRKLYNISFVETKSPSLSVTCDKGFTFSFMENVFICQKKNHIQVTLVFSAPDVDCFVKHNEAYQNVTCYKVHIYAVKAEAPHKRIDMEQSLADRSKRPYHPMKFPTNSNGSPKALTIGRLHFSETTLNNMRKKGKLNPDQRYFLLVVDVRAHTKHGSFSVCCQASQKLIVRASNPGQFENDVALWAKDKNGDSVHRMGQVGINTDKPDECLSVNGNFQLTGQILQPSDIRLLRNVVEQSDTRAHFETLLKMKIYKYRYRKEFLDYAGFQDIENYGVLGHEIRSLVPGAVRESSDIILPDGSVVKVPLFINKDRLLIECIGAVQEACQMVKMVTSRMVEIETKNEILEVILKNTISLPKEMKDHFN